MKDGSVGGGGGKWWWTWRGDVGSADAGEVYGMRVGGGSCRGEVTKAVLFEMCFEVPKPVPFKRFPLTCGGFYSVFK